MLCCLSVRFLRTGRTGSQQRDGHGHGRRDEPRLRKHAVVPTLHTWGYSMVPGMGTCKRGCNGGDMYRAVHTGDGRAVDIGCEGGHARPLGTSVCSACVFRSDFFMKFCAEPASSAWLLAATLVCQRLRQATLTRSRLRGLWTHPSFLRPYPTLSLSAPPHLSSSVTMSLEGSY